MRRHWWLAWLAGTLLAPRPASAVSLVIDRLDTPDVVQAGTPVSFAFSLHFEPDEILEGTQAEIRAPHLTGFQPLQIAGENPWDLISGVGIRPTGKPLWIHAENPYGADPPGVTGTKSAALRT